MKQKYAFCVSLLLASLMLAKCGLRDNTVSMPVATVAQASLSANTHVTKTSSVAKQPTESAQLTPNSTLPPDEAFRSFTGWIEKNEKCKLPCWLGIVPGQTDFSDVVYKFSQFSAIAHTDFTVKWASIRVFFPNLETAKYSINTDVYPATDGVVSWTWVYAVAYQNRNGPRDYNNPEFQKLWQRYFVPGVFTEHGPPKKIFLDTTQIVADTEGPYPFFLWIVYPQQGFLIRYQGLNSKINESIRICPMQSSIEIRIWDTEKASDEEFMQGDRAMAGSFLLGPQPIESVTDFDIQSFYKTFTSAQSDTCFETPASIWPH